MQEPFSPGFEGLFEGLDINGGSMIDPDLVVEGYLDHMETALVNSPACDGLGCNHSTMPLHHTNMAFLCPAVRIPLLYSHIRNVDVAIG